MCGIAGIVSKHPKNQSYFIQQMLEKIAHRGPDGSGIVQAGPMIFGHQRLTILDLSSRASQPMWDITRRYCLVFNGEIYNFSDLKTELVYLGHRFHTHSDTEVLLNAWVQWGVNSLEKLVGMFAFAIWDVAEQTLFLVRDRMGEKPLFYSGVNGNLHDGLIFASELKALYRHPAVKKTLSLAAISEFLSQNYLLTETSIFEEISKLPAAHYLVYKIGEYPKKVCYWRLENFFHHKSNMTIDDSKDQLLHLIKNAVSLQSYADVEVGAFLSGGIDSSTIVAQMAQQNARNVHTFSVGFSEKSYNEIPASKITANYLNVSHQTKMISSPPIQEWLLKLAYVCDEPFADTSIIPTYLLAKFARQFVKVSLSGDGGDELFGGYATYQADRWHRYVNKFPKKMIQMLQQFINRYGLTSFSKVSVDYKLKQFLRGCLHDFQRAHAGWRTVFSMDEKIQLFRSEYRDIALLDPFTKIQPFFKQVDKCHLLDQAMYVDIQTWLVDDILVKVDRASMANSLEVRSPFLDHRIVEFAASLPVKYKIYGRKGKYILKESQVPFLPKTILKRRKEGFNSPMAIWLNNDLHDMAYSMTTHHRLLTWFEKSAIEKLWKQHEKHEQDNSYRLFGLLNLSLWLEAFNS